jgi:hypothetical protein
LARQTRLWGNVKIRIFMCLLFSFYISSLSRRAWWSSPIVFCQYNYHFSFPLPPIGLTARFSCFPGLPRCSSSSL